MALTEEQRSLLQLLLQGQSYEDIGSLLGVGTDDVRARARAALEEIGGTDPDARVGLSDFLLGQADPIGRADAVRQLQNDPDSNGLAQSLVAQLRLLAPQAQLPDVPPLRGGRGAQPAPPPAPGPAAPGSPPAPRDGGEPLSARIARAVRGLGGGDPKRSKAIIAIGLLAILVIVVVLVVLLTGGGDDGDGGGTTGTETTAANDELTIVQLAPLQEGGQASGQAVFAQTGDQPIIQLNLVGLEPAPKGETYIVWLYSSDRAAFPLARDQVQQNGALTGAAAVPQAVVPLLGQFGCVDVSLASNAETRKALQQAVDGQSLPAHSGQTVLRGEIPAAPGEQAASGAASQCDRAAAQPPG
ncbi:MAG TPA: hypothetical protein VFN15_05520 [Solirubrobacterales bacterium]|nr:hypothetical protein [Solirubrobacterales bacterium]